MIDIIDKRENVSESFFDDLEVVVNDDFIDIRPKHPHIEDMKELIRIARYEDEDERTIELVIYNTNNYHVTYNTKSVQYEICIRKPVFKEKEKEMKNKK